MTLSQPELQASAPFAAQPLLAAPTTLERGWGTRRLVKRVRLCPKKQRTMGAPESTALAQLNAVEGALRTVRRWQGWAWRPLGAVPVAVLQAWAAAHRRTTSLGYRRTMTWTRTSSCRAYRRGNCRALQPWGRCTLPYAARYAHRSRARKHAGSGIGSAGLRQTGPPTMGPSTGGSEGTISPPLPPSLLDLGGGLLDGGLLGYALSAAFRVGPGEPQISGAAGAMPDTISPRVPPTHTGCAHALPAADRQAPQPASAPDGAVGPSARRLGPGLRQLPMRLLHRLANLVQLVEEGGRWLLALAEG